ncbi:MAG: hypothetical protein HFE90_03580 [Firmicutes bacterium]|nr:hypothetical protein [Bacillota bacterium]
MKLKERFREYEMQTRAEPREEKIQETIRMSKEIFYKKEQESMLGRREFLWIQFRLIRKRWWLLQMLLLTCAVIVLPAFQEDFYIKRSIGVVGVLFIVLVIPEIWKNRSNRCIEIEQAAYYSLNQIYAARIFLFGITDVFMLTIFCSVLHGRLQFTFSELMMQFLFPAVVTACICFGLLCSNRLFSETASAAFCIIWSAVWWMITVNQKIYAAVVMPVWIALFCAAVLFLGVFVYKFIHDCNKCWEADSIGIESM